MRTTAIFSAALLLTLACAAAVPPPTDFASRVRRIIDVPPPHEISATPEPESHERVQLAVQQAGIPQGQLETILFDLFAQEIASGRGPRRTGLAGSVLDVLGHLGSAAAFDGVLEIATHVPESLEPSANAAVARIAAREAPDRIPEAARRLSEGKAEPRIYAMLYDTLDDNWPVDAAERDRRIRIILNVFKERLRDPTDTNRIYLDRKLEQLAPAYRASAERRRYLLEEAQSENPNVKSYAERKLRDLPATEAQSSPNLPLRAVSAPIAPVSAPVAAHPAVPIKDDHDGEGSTLSVVAIVIGSVAVAGILGWLFWKLSR